MDKTLNSQVNITRRHIVGRLLITLKCNHDCAFCSATPKEKELPLEEVKEKIVELKNQGITDLMLTGGEPTIRKDFFEILDFCNEMNFDELTIQTNGSNLDNIELVKKIKEIKGSKIYVSFHSYDPETFGKISSRPENYQKILNGFKLVIENKIPVFVTTVINKLNYKHLKEHINFIHTKFPAITHFSFNFTDPAQSAIENRWIVPTFAETELYIQDLMKFMIEKNLTFRIEKLPMCYMAGFEEYCSDMRRELFDEPRLLSQKLMNLDRENMNDLVIEKKPQDNIYAPQCNHCTLKSLCQGIHNQYAKLYGVEEVYPVFEDPAKIIERARPTKH